MEEGYQFEGGKKVLRVIGWVFLILCLPLVLLGIGMPANKYRPWGVNAVDCDGPLKVWIVAVPCLLIYGAALIINLIGPKKPINIFAIAMFFLFCVMLSLNIASAIHEDDVQATVCWNS